MNKSKTKSVSRMATFSLQQISSLTSLLIVLVFLQCELTLGKETGNVKVKLRNCCFKQIENDSFCNEEIALDWVDLQTFRIPKVDNTTSIIIDTTLTVNDNNPSSLECKNGDSTKQFIIPKWDAERQNVTAKGFFAFFSDDGHFQYDENIFDTSEFCISRQESSFSDDTSSDSITVTVCNKRATECSSEDFLRNDTDSSFKKLCLVRCCNYGEVWDLKREKLRCVDSGENKWKPTFFEDLNSDKVVDENEETPTVMVYHPRGLVKKYCKTLHALHSPNPILHPHQEGIIKTVKTNFKLLKDGTVWIKPKKSQWTQLFPGEYCVDGFQFGPKNYSGDNSETVLFECHSFETKQEKEGRARQRKFSLVFGILLFFCLLFLVMTALVYILLWSKHNIHGWTVFGYIIALLLAYLSLGVSHIASISLVRYEDQGIWSFCGVLGVICHFTFLSVFSWSTVLNFDLWCTFRNLRPSSGKSKGIKKFLAYTFFALIVPTLIVTTGIVLDVAYREEDDAIITPDYGVTVCYVEPRRARVYFVLLPIAILLGINFVLFCNTVISVYKVKKSTRFASASSTKNEASNQTFRLILKLMLVNGTIWIVEIISWYLQTGYEEVGMLSFVLDVINVLQAVAIFFLFVFKNDILNALKRTYPSLEGVVACAYKVKNLTKSLPHGETTNSTMDTSCHSKSKPHENENVQVSKV